MDTYSKGVLTAIAVLLAVIATGIWLPIVDDGLAVGSPTFGDVQTLREIEDEDTRSEAYRELLNRMPYVKVHGSVDVDGTVTVDRVRGTVNVSM